MKNLNEVITNTIKELGMPARLVGYHYTRYAIELMVDDINLMNSITGTLYPKIAQKFNTTVVRVERGIRSAIETGWKRANVEFADKIFGYSVDANKGKPTNSEFIAMISDNLKLRMNLKKIVIFWNHLLI